MINRSVSSAYSSILQTIIVDVVHLAYEPLHGIQQIPSADRCQARALMGAEDVTVNHSNDDGKASKMIIS